MANNIFKKKDIKLDTFANLNEEMIASFSQGDRLSDKLVMALTNNGVPLDLTDATKVRIDFRKPDGNLVFQYCTMEDKPNGLISAILTTQTLAAPGEVYAEVTVQYPEGKDAVTRQFTFWVQDAIASDKSLESTNEFPMLERAIVAGDMLAGVDLVAIIKAGELAAAALPKTGGDMTGNINFQTKSGAKAIQWYNDLAQLGRVVFHPSGLVEWFGKNGATENGAWNYSPSTNTFNVVSNTNLAKKTDFYMDYSQVNGNTINSTQQDLNTIQKTGVYGGDRMLNAPNNSTGFFYVEVVRYSDTSYVKQVATTIVGSTVTVYTRKMTGLNTWNAWAESIQSTGGTMTGTLNLANSTINWENLFLNNGGRRARMFMDNTNGTAFTIVTEKTAGAGDWDYSGHLRVGDRRNWLKNDTDTMTGHLNMSSNSQINYNQLTNTSSAKGFMYTDDASSTVVGGIGRYKTPTVDAYYMGWGSSPWGSGNSLQVSNTQLTYKNFAITTAEKDGQLSHALTAEATNPDVNNPLQSIRRSNTVTTQGAITLQAAYSGGVVATLPVNMRPVANASIYVPSQDGTQTVQIFINASTGAMALSANAKGKRVEFVLTYAAN